MEMEKHGRFLLSSAAWVAPAGGSIQFIEYPRHLLRNYGAITFNPRLFRLEVTCVRYSFDR